ncbi:hypothetical protein BASA81_004061 [Batrachochytrium salamandrivorans]|nr:hypothetical protein BASA81_004061 [Batrachochytrium salamandrivorans]
MLSGGACSIWSGNVFAPQESNKYEFAHTMQTGRGSRARCCGIEKGGRRRRSGWAAERELLALPKDLKRVRHPEPSAKRAELYVAPTESSKRVVGVDPGKVAKRSPFSAATAYFTKKNEVNARLFPHYEQEAYRVLKWRAFVNRRRSEDRMVNRFRDKFGGKDEVVLVVGAIGAESPR